MRFSILAAGCIIATAGFSPATAGVFTDDLTRCLVRSATDADRQALLRWIFLAASSSPGLSDLIDVSEQDREAGTEAAAGVFNRLLLADCRAQAVEAARNEGEAAFLASFQTLGEAAGRDMMSNPSALAELERLDTYLDGAGLEALGREIEQPSSGSSDRNSTRP